MKLRKVGRVKSSEVKAYQKANGLAVDGKVGNQTFGHLVDALEACRNQPDDPGAAQPMPANKWSGLSEVLTLALFVAIVAAVYCWVWG